MRHRVKGKKFNRHLGARNALEFSLVKACIENPSVTTSLQKAKFVKPQVEKLVTKAKKGDTLVTRRYLLSKLRNNKSLVEKLISNYSVKYKTVNGGYMRIQKAEKRSGDNAQMAVLSWVDSKKPNKVETKKVEKKSTPKTKKAAKKSTEKTKKTTKK
jgi:large subunit ribosomal protein L17